MRLARWPLGRVLTLSVLVVVTLPPAAGAQDEPSESPQEPAASVVAPVGELVEGIACLEDSTQTYTLYLPSAYSTDRRWPVLFIFDPRGRSVTAAEIFRQAAERYGWILMSSDNTRSDGPWEPNFKAVRAMVPDAGRYAVDSDRLYAAGFSGGAMLAWVWAQHTGGVAGVIASGGRPVEIADAKGGVSFAHFGAAGEAEFNYLPTRELDDIAARAGAPHRFEAFPGPHAWMPPELALAAVEWMELEAMRSGKRDTDPKLVAELYEKDLETARELEEAGDLLAAMRRHEAIARTFEGLRETGTVAARAAELADSREVKRALKAESAAHRFEKNQLQQMAAALAQFRVERLIVGGESEPGPDEGFAGEGSSPVMSVSELERALGLPRLLASAEKETPQGLAARRVLDSMSAQLGFYLPRDFFQSQDYSRASVALEIAAKIGPPRPFVLYNLASAKARLGKRKAAIAALARAVEAGYANVEYLEQDADLESLRELSEYKDLVGRMRSEAAEP